MKKPTNKTNSQPKRLKSIFLNKYSLANKKTVFLIITGLTTVIIIASFAIVLVSKNDPQPVITPLSRQQAQNSVKPSAQEATYYINIAQKFLTQAEELSKNPHQTTQDKEAILIAVQNSLTTINEGIVHYPKDDRLYAQRAKIYQGIASFSSGALEAAVADLDQARKLSPQNPIYPKSQSQILAQIGQYQDASFYAKLAYEIEPHNLQNLIDLSQIQIKAGQVDGAIKSYQTLLSLLPQDSQEIITIKKEIAELEKLLSQIKDSQGSSLYLTNEPTPNPRNIPADINFLPQEQAALPTNLIIATSQEKNNNQQSQGVDLNAFAGEATILSGQNQTIIYNHNLTETKKINLAPQDNTDNQVLYVKDRVANPSNGAPYFVVALSKPLNQNLVFKWWIIE
ncbi:MAG: tetratricopeptide repeat protein [Candidatus Shapirobacteria bacterium]|nr:tetratricopeptide repeat protein [Candidatus Shapirobacteria bacterium]